MEGNGVYYFKVIETKDFFIHRTAYGVITEDGRGHAAVVPNISCDKAFVTRLAERCERGRLAPEQLLDVVMDALLL